MPGTPAPKKDAKDKTKDKDKAKDKTKKSKKEKKDDAAKVAAAAAKGKGKGSPSASGCFNCGSNDHYARECPKPVADKGKGKGDGKSKGKGKGKGKGDSKRDIAEKTEHKDRTDEQKALVGCIFFQRGNCFAEGNCKYSHKDFEMNRLPPPRNKAAAAPPQEDGKAKPAAKSPAKAPAGVARVSAAVLSGITPAGGSKVPKDAARSRPWSFSRVL